MGCRYSGALIFCVRKVSQFTIMMYNDWIFDKEVIKLSNQKYTTEFKKQVVEFYLDHHTVKETLQEFHVPESTMFAWKQQYQRGVWRDLVIRVEVALNTCNGSSIVLSLQKKRAHIFLGREICALYYLKA